MEGAGRARGRSRGRVNELTEQARRPNDPVTPGAATAVAAPTQVF